MSVKAVYASKTLAIYITGTDVDDLLRGNIVLGPMIAADETIAPEGVDVRLTVPGIQALRAIQNAEIPPRKSATYAEWRAYVKRIGADKFR